MKIPKGFKFILDPYDYQVDSFSFASKKDNAGLLLDVGLGKTFIAINVARYRIQSQDVKKVLVVCPTTILQNWKNEIIRFSEYKPVILHHPIRENRIRMIYDNRYTFYIINYEALDPFLKHLLRIKFDMIIFDESSRYISNPDSMRTKASIALSDIANYKLLLTGTLIAGHPTCLWSQFRILDGGLSLGKNFYRFRNYFFFQKKYPLGFRKFFLRRDKTKLLSDLIYRSCIRIKKEDVLKDLPDKIFQVIELVMDEQLEEIYETVKRKIISEIEIETAEGKSTLTIRGIFAKLLRLQQITSGFIKNDRGEEVLLKYTPKLDALIEEVYSILDSKESVIIWCKFLKSIDIIGSILKRNKIPYITMFGEDKDKFKKWKGFQQSKKENIFIGQIESGGVGIELFKEETESRHQHMIYFENSWKLDTRLQTAGRIHRIGQKSTCLYKDLILLNTIDERILESISTNKKVSDLIMEKGVKEWLK